MGNNNITEKDLRALLYLRVSRDRYARLRGPGAEDRGSVERQEFVGNQIAADRGWRIVAVKRDSESASQYARKERGEWPEVLALIEAGEVDVLVLWETSRGDRKLTTWSALLDLCIQKKTLIHVVDHDYTYDPRNTRDWEILADEGVRNARESHKTSSRVKGTKKHLKMFGRPDGSIPFGYRSVYEQGILVRREPDPETAPTVRWLFTEYSKGAFLARLCRDMLERHPSRKWSVTVIRRILKNPRYIALIPDGPKFWEAQWEPLVEADLFWDVQDRLAKALHAGIRPGAAKHLCSVWTVGDLCGTPMRYVPGGQSSQGRAGRVRSFYRCKCGCVGLRADWLDGYVVSLVVAYWARPGIRKMLAARAEASSAALAELKKRQAELEARLVEIGQAGAALPVQVVVEMTAPVQAELDALAGRIESAMPASAKPLLEGDTEAEVLEAWHRLGREVGVSAQRDVLRGTLKYVRVRPRGRGFHREFDPSFVDAPYWELGRGVDFVGSRSICCGTLSPRIGHTRLDAPDRDFDFEATFGASNV